MVRFICLGLGLTLGLGLGLGVRLLILVLRSTGFGFSKRVRVQGVALQWRFDIRSDNPKTDVSSLAVDALRALRSAWLDKPSIWDVKTDPCDEPWPGILCKNTTGVMRVYGM